MDMIKTKMTLPKLTLLTAFLAISLNTTQAADQALNGIAAVVNNDVVLVTDVQRMAQRARASGNQDDNKTLFQKSLDNLVLEKLQIQEARRQGINPSEAQINQSTLEVANRNNMNLATFTEALSKEGVTLATFKKNIASQIMLSTLKRRQSQTQATASDQDIGDLIASETQQVSAGFSYRIQDILIPAPQPLASANFTQASRSAAQLRKLALKDSNFLSIKSGNSTATDLGWKEASQLSFAYLKELNTLEVGQISDVIQDARGFHVLKLVEKRGGITTKAYEVHVRHILISKDDADAKSKATRIQQQLKQGADFSTLAKINSADKGSAINGGDLGWSDSRKYVPAFSKATQTLALKTISPLIQTEFGYHILEVLDRKETDDNKKQLETRARKALAAQNKTSDYDTWVQSLRSKAFIDYRVKP
jgi:peptidyl-prolyl cis-trans isomerase SurA